MNKFWTVLVIFNMADPREELRNLRIEQELRTQWWRKEVGFNVPFGPLTKEEYEAIWELQKIYPGFFCFEKEFINNI